MDIDHEQGHRKTIKIWLQLSGVEFEGVPLAGVKDQGAHALSRLQTTGMDKSTFERTMYGILDNKSATKRGISRIERKSWHSFPIMMEWTQ